MITIKKLMILGSAPPFGYVVDYCASAGIKTVVCDKLDPDNPLSVKSRAWKSCYVNVNDLDQLEEIARENDVDGVFTSSSDILLDVYTKLCARLGLPCTTTRERSNLFFDKRANKDAFVRNGIPTAKHVLLTKDFCEEDIIGLRWPLIVKPSDSSGGKGMTIVHSFDELSDAVNTALSFSIHKYEEIVIEEYLEGDEVNIECWVENGNLSVLSINDKNCIKWDPAEPVLCLSTTNPSKYLARKDEFYSLAKKVCAALECKNGPLTIQTIVGSHGIAVIEPLGRIAGGNPFIILDKLTGINTCARMVNFALGQPNPELPECAADYDGVAQCMIFFIKKGQAVSETGFDELAAIPEVIAIEKYFNPGHLPATQKPFRFAVVHFHSDTFAELEKIEKTILGKVSVLDENGGEMLINKLVNR